MIIILGAIFAVQLFMNSVTSSLSICFLDSDAHCSKTFTVLDFTRQLVETGLEDDSILALVVFSLQYVLVSHEYWKYKAKYVRWKVTLKVHLGSLWTLLQLGFHFLFYLTW
jgi:nuclear pore complex protein Nup188